MPVTAAVVEDDPFTRTMLVATLRSQGVEVVIDTGEPAVALEAAGRLRPHVAVLDLHLGAGPTGVELAHALRKLDRGIGIVVLTSFDDPRLLSTRLPPLPRGTRYVTKREVERVEVLLRAIKEAVESARGATVSAVHHAPESSADRDDRPGTGRRVVDLTDSQLETLRLLAEGLSNAHIAARRSVTERSVETTIGRIARALGLAPDATRNQRVHMARVYLRATGERNGDAAVDGVAQGSRDG
jgi:two-component system, NarL family, nitrate/nitrite response regulator NarL